VTVYGMSDKLGALTYGERNEHQYMGRDFGTSRNYSEEVAANIDEEVKHLVDQQYQYVKTILTDNRDSMDAIVRVILEKETLDEREVHDIVMKVKAEKGEDWTPVNESMASKDAGNASSSESDEPREGVTASVSSTDV
jgi:cell division protease FtsH